MSLKSSNKVDTNRYELQITIDADAFEAAISKAYRQNVKKMNVPGFRRGKAPRGIVEKLYGENIFYEDAFNSLYPEAIDNAAEDAGVEIVDFKNVDFDLSISGATVPAIIEATPIELKATDKIILFFFNIINLLTN